MSSQPFPGITGNLQSPWRGTEFPSGPMAGQLFFLDVSNDDGRRGWYRATHSLVGRPVWDLVARPGSDHGDLVRPVAEVQNTEHKTIP